MKTHKKIVIWVLVFAFGLVGCATTQTGTQIGSNTDDSPAACIALYTTGAAVGGAVLGAFAGALIGGKQGAVKGAVIGAGAGGVAGFAYAWGKCFAKCSTVKSQQIKDYDQTSTQIGYSPQQGMVVKINEYSLDPSAISPMGVANFNANYYVMAPPEQKDITVTETRILKRFDNQKKQFTELGRVDEPITISPGLRRADGSFPIPEKVEEGKYLITFMVTSGDKTDATEMPLTITKDKQILAKAEEESRSRKVNTTNKETLTTKKETSIVALDKDVQPTESGEKAVSSTKEKSILIIANKASLRSGPNTKSNIVITLSKDEKYPLLEVQEVKKRKWYKIRLDNGESGWLSDSVAKVLEE